VLAIFLGFSCLLLRLSATKFESCCAASLQLPTASGGVFCHSRSALTSRCKLCCGLVVKQVRRATDYAKSEKSMVRAQSDRRPSTMTPCGNTKTPLQWQHFSKYFHDEIVHSTSACGDSHKPSMRRFRPHQDGLFARKSHHGDATTSTTDFYCIHLVR